MAQHPRSLPCPSIPSGTVAFLFTDIEGSTKRWETDQQAMWAAVERHFALLREAIAAQDGVLFKTIGDAVQAAFPTVPKAIAAAIDAQVALRRADWGELGPLRVRMAIHAGEATPRDGDYLAPALNRLSRVLGDRIWRADPAHGYGAHPGHDASRWLRAPGSGPAPPARPARGRAHLPALRTGTAGRVPAAEESRSAAEQPPGATDGADRPRRRARNPARDAGRSRRQAHHPDRSRGHRQDPARLAGRGRVPGRVPRRRLVGSAGRGFGPGSGSRGDRHGARCARGSRRASAIEADRAPAVPPHAAGARQPGAGASMPRR